MREHAGTGWIAVALTACAVASPWQTAFARPTRSGSIDVTAGTAVRGFTTTGLVPGDVVTRAIGIHNPSSRPVRYTLGVASSAGTLAARLEAVVRAPSDGGRCEPFTGDVLGRFPAGPASPPRALAPGARDTLCARVVFGPAAGDAYQEATATLRFTIDATG